MSSTSYASVVTSAEPQAQMNDITSSATVPQNAQQESSIIPLPSSMNSSEPSNAASRVQRMLNERRERLEAEQRIQEAAEEAERQERERARKQEAADAAAISQSDGIGAARSSRLTYAQEQVQKKKQDKLARERVLKQLEMDKLERKEREERRKAATKMQADTAVEPTLLGSPLTPSSQATGCSLQIRLLDGSTIRSRFEKHDTVAKTVRQWIDQNRTDGRVPYTFKHIMTPMPNRSLSTSDEHQMLQDTELLPSATLILVPVPGYTEAYGQKGRNIFVHRLSVLYNYIVATVLAVINAIKTFVGGQAPPQPTSVPRSPATTLNKTSKSTSTGSKPLTTASVGTSIRIRTLRDQDADRDDQQLYNGNQVSPAMADLQTKVNRL